MIFASVLAKLAMPEWARTLLLWFGGAFLVIVLLIGIKRHLVEIGVRQESDRRDLIDEENRKLMNAEFNRLNLKVAEGQGIIAGNERHIKTLEGKHKNEQVANAALQSDLVAGRIRMRIALAKAPATGDAKSFDGPGVAELGAGTGDYAFIPPTIAAALDGVRVDRNAYADRLEACISAYDAVKLASDRAAEP